jgi:hypothetical protein
MKLQTTLEVIFIRYEDPSPVASHQGSLVCRTRAITRSRICVHYYYYYYYY